MASWRWGGDAGGEQQLTVSVGVEVEAHVVPAGRVGAMVWAGTKLAGVHLAATTAAAAAAVAAVAEAIAEAREGGG